MKLKKTFINIGTGVEDNYTGASPSGSGVSVDGTVLEGRHD
jgi:hypothetical protein